MLYVTPSKYKDEASDHLPAIELKSEILPQVNENAVIFKVNLYDFTIFLYLTVFAAFDFETEENNRHNRGKALTENPCFYWFSF